MKTLDGEFLKRIGARIKELRERNGLTQEELAEMTDLTSRSISGIEAGNQDMSISNAYKITMALNTNLGYIVYGEYDFTSERILDMLRGCSDEKIVKIEAVVKACLEI